MVIAPGLLDHLFSFLSDETVDAIAKETRFIQRKRKFSAQDFLALLFDFHGNLIDPSLQELSMNLSTEQHLEVSRNAIDKKFTPGAVQFLRRLVQELMLCEQQLPLLRHPLATDLPFSQIFVMDATSVEVPGWAQERAKKTRQAYVKIQQEFDVLTGQLHFFSMDLENINDTVMGARRVPFLEGQELCLQDLGYFHFAMFEGIQEKEGYFLTRFRNDAYLAYKNPFPAHHPDGSVIASSEFQRIDLVGLCDRMMPGEVLELEEVYFGRDAHFPARCVLLAQSEEHKEKRREKLQRRAMKSRKTPKPMVWDLAGITGYMTNVPQEIPPEHVVQLYRLRWQVEWNIRGMKSFFGLDHFKLVKRERWLCHLYATLLMYLLSQLIAYQIRNMIWQEKEIEISETVAIRSIATHFLPKLYHASRQKKKTLQAYIPLITRLLTRTARKPNSVRGTAMKRLSLN